MHRQLEWADLAIAVLCSLAIAASTMLAASHWYRIPVACVVGEGCRALVGHPASSIAGIPIALIASVYWIGTMSLFLIFTVRMRWRAAVFCLTGFGSLFSLYMTYTSLFRLLLAPCSVALSPS